MPRLRSALGLLLLAGALAVPSSPAAAATSGLDPSFGDNGEVRLVLPNGAVATGQPVDTGDTVYVGGSAWDAPASRAVVVALDQRGRLRTGFGRGGVVVLPPPKTGHEPLDGTGAVVPDTSGHLLAVSNHSGPEGPELVVTRLRADDGRVDGGYGDAGRVLLPGAGGPAARDSQGRLYVSSLVVQDGTASNRVLRLTPSGRLDTTWGTDGVLAQDRQVTSLLVDQQDRLLVAADRVRRYASDGRTDPTFGTDGFPAGPAVTSSPDGSFLTASMAWTSGGCEGQVRRYDPSGQADAAFGDGGTTVVTPELDCNASNITIRSDDASRGVVLWSQPASDTDANLEHSFLLRVLPDGTLDETLDVEPWLAPEYGRASFLTTGPGGRITVAGNREGSTFNGFLARVVDDLGAHAGSTFVPTTPVRVLDTRTGLGARKSRVAAGSTVLLQVAGTSAVPAGASAVVLNVTAVAPSSGGHVTVHPTGVPRPLASNINLRAGVTTPNHVTVRIGDDGRVALSSTAKAVDLVADVAGYYARSAGVRFTPLRSPTRVLDTRRSGGAVTAAPGLSLRLAAVPAGATAVVLNVTAVSPTKTTHVTVWPDGAARPHASSLNVRPGEVSANLVTVALGPDRRVRLASGTGSVHLVVDAAGWYGPDGATRFVPLSPRRLLDTRYDDVPVGPGEEVPFDVETWGVPYGAAAVALNLTAVAPTSPGYVTAWPFSSTRPLASNLNTQRGVTVANAAVVAPDAFGEVGLFNASGEVDLVADVSGYFTD